MEKISVAPSKQFSSGARRAIFSILFFFLIYLLLLGLSLGIAAAAIYGAILLVFTYFKIVTLAIGIGLIGFGLLIVFFLIKFIFSSQKTDRSNLMELSREDAPLLFEMIEKIVFQVGTHFPKKIYLSSEVNASVFYDSSFWSMFLPVKKNLEIGIGLINTVTQTELEAILAHEFGHFSQRSMKVGSYVYQVNQAIVNMLYDNDSFERVAESWASISGYFYFFAKLAMKVIQGIQWLLRKLYSYVNLSYLGLSREMEFHADEIAANVTGYQPLASSLYRLNLSDFALQGVFDFYQERIDKNMQTKNLFINQSACLNILSEVHEIPLIHGLPEVNAFTFNRFSQSKLVIKDQWASHPTVDDRVKKLKETGILKTESTNSPANLLFVNINNWQEKFTDKIFNQIETEGAVHFLSPQEFEAEYRNFAESFSFGKIYNGYYDQKSPEFSEDWSQEENYSPDFNELFSDQKISLIRTSEILEQDKITLEMISNGQIKIKTFDYDGIKYSKKESKGVSQKIELELDKIKAQIAKNDEEIFKAFAFLNGEKKDSYGNTLRDAYRSVSDFESSFSKMSENLNELNGKLMFVEYTTPFEEINMNFRSIKPLEKQLKEDIQNLKSLPKAAEFIAPEMNKAFDSYLENDLIYFSGSNYLESNLTILFNAKNYFNSLLFSLREKLKKELLSYQLEILNEN